MTIWNPWHGCRRISPGCLHCYMYRRDAAVGRDSTVIEKTASFDLPVRKKRDGSYKLAEEGTVYVCMTSDFWIEEADGWRPEAWRMIRERSDLRFTIVTKRIDRFFVGLPADWGEGYPNVTVCTTCENQTTADFRLPVFLSLPIRRRTVIHEPMLEEIKIAPYLAGGGIAGVICGGESGPDARLCSYDWILSTRRQCAAAGVAFTFKQTGARFEKNGKIYAVPRSLQIPQARKAGIDLAGRG